MPFVGQIIENPITGERIEFLETVALGRRGVRERSVQPQRPHEQRPHIHATLTETFEILQGTARYRLDTQEHRIKAGETVTLPPKIAHVHPWNVGDDVLRLRQTVTFDTHDVAGVVAVEEYLITTFGLARDGRSKPDGSPPLLQIAVSLNAALPHVYAAGIPLPIQRVLWRVLSPLGKRRGYTIRYPQQ